jgi:tetratricopeptide (TPR) repeat protein
MSVADQARAHLEAGEFAAAAEAAAAGLREAPDDPELLRVAGRAGVETGSADAIDQLRRVTELEPDSAEAWRDLGDALATEGRSEESAEAFRKTLELDPEDGVAMTALGHTSYQAGEDDAGVKLLERAAERLGGNSTAVISLVEIYRSLGKNEEALAAARKAATADPGDSLHALDVAELSMLTGDLDGAAEALARLRDTLDSPEEEVGALHGMILVELERDDPERALALARDALAIDGVGRTAGVVAHLEVVTGSDPTTEAPRDASAAAIGAQGVPPTREEVEKGLRASLGELRRRHATDRRSLEGDLLG